MANFYLIRGDSSDIGFASTCLAAGAISFSEFKEWIFFVIENSEDVPPYMFEILELENRLDYIRAAREILGFQPAWNADERELCALDGVGYKRFKNFMSDASGREKALKCLDANQHVEALFRYAFPFINLE